MNLQKRLITFCSLALLFLSACAQTVPPAAQTDPASELPAATEPAPAQPEKRTATSSEFGLSLAFDPALAQDAVIQAVEPVALSQERMFAEAHPGYLRVTFPGYAMQRAAQLPYPISEPQVMIFRTGDFAAYTTDSPNDFPAQQAALQNLLATGLGAERCTQPPDHSASFMPYLPWTNAAQVFCAQAKEIPFGSGKGVRYITSYSQGMDPVLDPFVFYTFQGLTSDGQYYIAAVFPLDTSIFPEDVPQNFVPDLVEMNRTLAGQIEALNSQPADAFSPSLALLDEMLQSLTLKE